MYNNGKCNNKSVKRAESIQEKIYDIRKVGEHYYVSLYSKTMSELTKANANEALQDKMLLSKNK